MSTVSLIFPHQLFKESPLLKKDIPVLLIEEFLFFKHYRFHQQKIAFHRATMKAYADYLKSKKIQVEYVQSTEDRSDVRKLIPSLAKEGVETIHYLDPTDYWLDKRICENADQAGIQLECHPSRLFLNKKENLSPFFRTDKKKFHQTTFYKDQRKERQILVDAQDEPLGGKWTFDKENRKKYPAKKSPPQIKHPEKNKFYEEAISYVEQNFGDNPGELKEAPLYPIDFAASEQWLDNFLKTRFEEFGTYEDAIVQKETILNHSVLTPMLNTGLLAPQYIVDKAVSYAEKNDIPINSTEGFVRQIIGWREFIRGIYEVKGTYERTRNFWGFERKIPASFYDGTTGILPVDDTIQKVLKTGYCHHIERLMILGNFMLLCEFDPDEVYRWFMELFIDAYDWVMVPNVYGMSQFADGGLMSTKPYISGSNYIMKMSDYKKGDWQETWDALFWRFMHVHRSFFTKNPRMGMLVGTFDKMDDEKQNTLLETAEDFLKSLS